MKERLCNVCLRPSYECSCTEEPFDPDPVRLRLKRLGIKDPKELVKACIAHGTGRLRRAEEPWYSQR